jgi:hypothetical protein
MVQAVPAASPRSPALRLRCLACHASLAEAGDEVTRLRGRLEVPAAPVELRWYAMVHGEVVGPVGRDELARLHHQRVLDDDGLVWHDGFRGWARLCDTATFAPLVGGRRPAPRVGRAISGVLDLTDDVDLVEVEPPQQRRAALPPPVSRRIARAS